MLPVCVCNIPVFKVKYKLDGKANRFVVSTKNSQISTSFWNYQIYVKIDDAK